MALESQLLNRSYGDLLHRRFQDGVVKRLIDGLAPTPGISFDGSNQISDQHIGSPVWAHRSGANTIAIDRFEGQFLVTGGADASIHLWDLSATPEASPAQTRHEPLLTAPRSKNAHTHGITYLSFYPFDSEAILSSSYDHSLKISSTHTLSPTASFPLGSRIHAHAMSPIAQHVLIACATQASIVRLVDLRSGAMAQGLIGHQGEVLNVAWSPKREHILASAGADGTVRLWDIRRSASAIGQLDLEDEIGLVARGGQRMWGRAHVGPCNAVAWTPDGDYIVSAGHDERIRVWDAATGRNTLVHFGPSIRNKNFSAVSPVVVNEDGRDVIFWPNEKEIVVGDLMHGRILRKLRPSGSVIAQGGTGTRIVKDIVNSLAYRGAGHVELYSAHADGIVRGWVPERGLLEEKSTVAAVEEDEHTKKRKALSDIHRDFTRQRITFS